MEVYPMKKLLAVVLTLAMLVSCFAIAASAAQQVRTYTPEEKGNHYWTWTGSWWCPIQISNNADTFQMDIKLGAGASFNSYNLNDGCGIACSTSQIGLDGAKVSAALGDAQWHTVKWQRVAGGTEMFVDDASVGTVALSLAYYTGDGGFRAYIGGSGEVNIDNIVAGTYSEDFEDELFQGGAGQGLLNVDTHPESYTNDLKWSYENATDIILCWGDHSAPENYYFAWHAIDEIGSANVNAAYTKFDYSIRADSPLAYAGNWYEGTPAMDASAGNIGLSGQRVSFTWTVGEWYNVSMVCHANVTSIYVDGDLVGQVSGSPLTASYMCGPQNFVSYNDYMFSTSADGLAWTTVWSNNFDTKQDLMFDVATTNAPGGGLSGAWWGTNVINVSEDLGLYYWQNVSGQTWHPVDVAGGTPEVVSMDVRLDDATSTLTNFGLSNAPSFSAAGVGLNNLDNLVSYTFTPGTWYNIKWQTNGENTDIYVDGVKIGSASGNMSLYEGTQFYWSPYLISVDNVRLGQAQVFDFETDANVTAWTAASAQGARLPYDFSDLKKSIPELCHGANYDAATAAAGETAWILSIGANNSNTTSDNNNCWYFADSPVANVHDAVLDFNLALIASTDDRCANTQPYFDIWLNSGCNSRFIVKDDSIGMSKAGADDLVSFQWGPCTADNIRNITIALKSSFNKINIFVDGEMVYESNMGCDYATMLGWLGLIGQTKNCVAQVSNYGLYDLEGNAISQSTTNCSGNGALFRFETRTVGADCETAGHVWGSRTVTTAPTCHTYGKYTITCAYCGEYVTQMDVATVAHNYNQYSVNYVDPVTGESVVECKYEGCPSKYYTANLAPEQYTGTYCLYWDFRDEMYTLCTPVSDRRMLDYFNYDAEAGAVWTDWHKGNYNENHFAGDARADWHDYSISFDFTVKSLNKRNDGWVQDGKWYVTDNGRTVYIWTGGANGITRQVGMDFDDEVDGEYRGVRFYLGDRMGGVSSDMVTEAIFTNFNIGETYNFKMSYYIDETTFEGGIYLYINNNLVMSYTTDDDPDLYFDLVYGAAVTGDSLDWWIIRQFNTEFWLDNLTVGNGAFTRIDRQYNGDADGDYAITAADATAIRLVLSGNADAADLTCKGRADANIDGKINAKDLLIVRIALAA